VFNCTDEKEGWIRDEMCIRIFWKETPSGTRLLFDEDQLHSHFLLPGNANRTTDLREQWDINWFEFTVYKVHSRVQINRLLYNCLNKCSRCWASLLMCICFVFLFRMSSHLTTGKKVHEWGRYIDKYTQYVHKTSFCHPLTEGVRLLQVLSFTITLFTIPNYSPFAETTQLA
jgi:hypothetical protein